jgi:hypothetical protein
MGRKTVFWLGASVFSFLAQNGRVVPNCRLGVGGSGNSPLATTIRVGGFLLLVVTFFGSAGAKTGAS